MVSTDFDQLSSALLRDIWPFEINQRPMQTSVGEIEPAASALRQRALMQQYRAAEQVRHGILGDHEAGRAGARLFPD